MEKMKYDAKELAEMAIRNIDSAKSCSGAACGDPVDCVVKVIEAPLGTLADTQRQLMDAMAKINELVYELDFVKANVPGGDKAIAQARESYFAGKMTANPAHLNN